MEERRWLTMVLPLLIEKQGWMCKKPFPQILVEPVCPKHLSSRNGFLLFFSFCSSDRGQFNSYIILCSDHDVHKTTYIHVHV